MRDTRIIDTFLEYFRHYYEDASKEDEYVCEEFLVC